MRQSVKLWLKALRSGEYLQAKERLKEADEDGQMRYCCLGVACEIYNQTHKKAAIENKDGDEDLSSFPQVRKWLGLRTNGGTIKGGLNTSLVELNDRGRNFRQIADIITNYQEEIFK